MQEDSDTLKTEILDSLEHLDVLLKHSINRFDQEGVYTRAYQLLDTLNTKVHELTHLIKNPISKQNQSVQDLLFNLKKMKQAGQDLKENPQKLELQQAFQDGIDHIKQDLNQLFS